MELMQRIRIYLCLKIEGDYRTRDVNEAYYKDKLILEILCLQTVQLSFDVWGEGGTRWSDFSGNLPRHFDPPLWEEAGTAPPPR